MFANVKLCRMVEFCYSMMINVLNIYGVLTKTNDTCTLTSLCENVCMCVRMCERKRKRLKKCKLNLEIENS